LQDNGSLVGRQLGYLLKDFRKAHGQRLSLLQVACKATLSAT
jgi:hypothetical protein